MFHGDILPTENNENENIIFIWIIIDTSMTCDISFKVFTLLEKYEEKNINKKCFVHNKYIGPFTDNNSKLHAC